MEAASIPKARARRAITAENAPLIVLGVLMLASFVLIVGIATKLTFFQDTWDFLINRRSFSIDSLMIPHNEHIVLIPVLIQQFYLLLFGMKSAMPEYVGEAILLMVTAGVVFVYARRRVGDWAAVIVAALLLFIGTAWETLIWPFEICFVGPILFGTAMLLMLEREDRRGDVLACLFLAIAIGFNSLGVAFIAAGAIEVLQRAGHDGRRVLGRDWVLAALRRAWIVVIPAVLYLLWYAKWGSAATGAVTLENFLTAPRYMFDCLAANLEALFGLAKSGDAGLGWGRPLAVGALVGIAVVAWRRPGLFARIWPPLATLAAYWFLLALNHDAAREPNTSRYLYAGVALVLVVGVNVLEGVRLKPRVLIVAGAVAAVAIFSNLGVMKIGAEHLRQETILTKTALGIEEIARPVINPLYVPTAAETGSNALFGVTAGKYFEAVDAEGSPAYSPAAIAAATPPTRQVADKALYSAEHEHLGLARQGGGWSESAPAGAKCAEFEGSGGTQVQMEPGANTIEVAPGPAAHIFLRRFATEEFPVDLGTVKGDSVTKLNVPRDNASSSYPWYVDVEAQQSARVCLPR
jgi:hypothetical protein